MTRTLTSTERKIPLYDGGHYRGDFCGRDISAIWNDHADRAKAFVNSYNYPYGENDCIIYGFKEYDTDGRLTKVSLTRTPIQRAFTTHLQTFDHFGAENSRYIFGIAYRKGAN